MLVIPLFLPTVFARLAAAEDLDVSFIRDYISKEGCQSSLYSMITCNLSKSRKLVLAISDRRRGLTSVHSATNSLENWVNFDEVQTFILDVKCLQAEAILREANSLNLFRKPFTWLLIGLSSNHETAERDTAATTHKANILDDYETFFDTLYVPLSSNMRITVRSERDRIRLRSLYKISPEGPLISEDLGSWTRIAGFDFDVLPCPARRRTNLRRNVLTAGVVYQMAGADYAVDDLADKHIDGFSRANYVLTRELARMMNLRLSVKLFRSWGVVNENGTWDAMVGELQMGKIEFLASPLYITANRMHLMEFLEKLTPISMKFIYLSPPLSFANNIFTLPFHGTVWICTTGIIVVSSIILYFAIKAENRDWSEKNSIANPDTEPDGNNEETSSTIFYQQREDSLSDIVLLNIGAVCMQGTDQEPQGLSGRLIMILMHFSYMFLYVSYSACIVALLQSSDMSIRTLRDLYDSPLTLGAHDNSYNRFYFKGPLDEIRKAIYENRIDPKEGKSNFLPLEEGCEKVRKGLFAFHSETSESYHVVQKTFTEGEKCALQELAYLIAMEPYFALRKFSPFTEIFRIGMKRLAERGFSHRQVLRMVARKPICTSRSSNFVTVGLVDCFPAFKVLVAGFISSVVLVFAEKLLKQKFDSLGRLGKSNTVPKWKSF